MFATPSLFCALVLAGPPVIESKFEQVGPAAAAAGKIVRRDKQLRAVILIHGYRPYPTAAAVAHADFRPWQLPDGKVPNAVLVRELTKEADVFSYGYSQNGSVDEIVAAGGLGEAVRRLRDAGYQDVVLVGHSAGGLVARQFVEDNPDAGVTKVVQACAPNGGTDAGEIVLHKTQEAFLKSLTRKEREQCLKARAGKTIPDKVQFVFILSNYKEDSDGLVRCDCQWTADLQLQCVPVMTIKVVHMQVPYAEKGVEAIVTAVKQDQPRWKPEHVRAVKDELFKFMPKP